MDSQKYTPAPQSPKLLDRVRAKVRLLHYSHRTEEAYVHWIKRYILFHNKQHPMQMGEAEIEAFLSHLAVKERVAASTQNQALAALLFLYQKVLERPLNRLDAVRAQRPQRLPEVLSAAEVRLVLGRMTGTARLMAELLYGGGSFGVLHRHDAYFAVRCCSNHWIKAANEDENAVSAWLITVCSPPG